MTDRIILLLQLEQEQNATDGLRPQEQVRGLQRLWPSSRAWRRSVALAKRQGRCIRCNPTIRSKVEHELRVNFFERHSGGEFKVSETRSLEAATSGPQPFLDY